MPEQVKVIFLHNTNYNIQDKSSVVPEPNLFAARSLSAVSRELRENGVDQPVDSFRTTSAVSHTPPELRIMCSGCTTTTGPRRGQHEAAFPGGVTPAWPLPSPYAVP